VTTAQVTGVPLSSTVAYTVKAHDAAGNQSAASNTWTHTGDSTAPTAPTNLTGTTSGTTVTLTWTASTDNVGVTGYDLYVNGAFSKTVTGTSTTDTEASSASVTYSVKARDAAGNLSAASNTFTRGCVSGCTDTTPPTAPANLTGSTSGTTVTLNWGASTDNVGVSAYDVYSDAGGSTPIGTVSGTTTTFTVSNVATTTTVTYTVKARDAAGNSSAASNGWTHQGQTAGCTTPVDQASGKTATSSSDTFTFVAANAIDVLHRRS
jgi:chitodextrinase